MSTFKIRHISSCTGAVVDIPPKNQFIFWNHPKTDRKSTISLMMNWDEVIELKNLLEHLLTKHKEDFQLPKHIKLNMPSDSF